MATLTEILSDSGTNDELGSITGSSDDPISSPSTSKAPSHSGAHLLATSTLPSGTNITSASPTVTFAPTTPQGVEQAGSSTQPPNHTPVPRIDPAPNILAPVASSNSVRFSTKTMTCKTEWIGDYDGDPTQLEDFLTRLRDLIRSETQEELIPAWTKAVLRTLPRTFKGNAAISNLASRTFR
ncbi:hypothetical protein A4X09_0g2173 [Tilletia walkeri]|uniref:Uncharacterized protein n=1 Tax=Tilletia walkeri TaxID=117179 RepID=A0A8X7T624_9BASI|nr:hypothetical protein A4X09_0g2173 [Tilletia walkeri]